MKKIFNGLLVGALTFGMWSCSSEDNPWVRSGEKGGIYLNLLTDGNISSATRADDSQATIVPDVSQFAINLTKSDNSLNKRWSRVEDFNKEDGFPMGSYLLEASFGEKGLEGFSAAYYYASEDVTVRPDEETSVSMTATLANAMVSIRYTENFSRNFRAYSSAVRTSGSEPLVFAQNETRAAYINPGHTEVNITMTNMNGDTQTINPANFEAEARHHYIITINAIGGGAYEDLLLDVQFEEDVVAETVEVNLGDALFEAPAPVVNAVGFNVEDNDTRSIFENDLLPGNPRFEIFAFGGLKSVSMTYSGPDAGPALPFGEINLMNTDATNQAIIRNAGLDVSGLFKNPDKMGVVGISDFVRGLHEGTHILTLQVTDVRTLVSEPVSFKVTVSTVSYTIEPVNTGKYVTDALDLYLTANIGTLKDDVKFYVNDGNGDREMTVSSSELVSSEDGEYKFKYSLALPSGVTDAPLDVKAVYGKKSAALEYVKYSVDVDAFARYAKFRVNTKETADRDAIMQALTFEGLPAGASVNKNGTDGIIIVSGFSKSTTYNLTVSTPGFENQLRLPTFTTEAETDVPNGDFSQTDRTMYFDNINVGGLFEVTVNLGLVKFTDDYQITSSIDRSEPTGGWASINEKTCYEGSNPLNTWFVVPSTFVDGNKVVIRSVGYNHSGSVPAKSGGNMNTNYYCTNTPSQSNLSKSAGELFLGKYTYTGQESRTDGVGFGSRPSSVSFNYEYVSYNNESGLAEFALYDASGSKIAELEFRISATTATASKSIQFSYPYGKKAAKLVIRFKSTADNDVSINIPAGDALSEGIGNIRGNLKIGANTYHALATGSELRISNVHFGYDAPAAEVRSKAKRR